MQITIDIDPEKIDYDKITEQICEKIKDAPIEEFVDKSGALEKVLRSLFWNDLRNKFDDYMCTQMGWIRGSDGYPTEKFKTEVQRFRDDMLKEKFEETIKGFVDSLDEEALKDGILKIAPNVMLATLISHMSITADDYKARMLDEAFENSKGAVRYAFHSNGMAPHTPYDRNNLPNSDY